MKKANCELLRKRVNFIHCYPVVYILKMSQAWYDHVWNMGVPLLQSYMRCAIVIKHHLLLEIYMQFIYNSSTNSSIISSYSTDILILQSCSWQQVELKFVETKK